MIRFIERWIKSFVAGFVGALIVLAISVLLVPVAVIIFVMGVVGVVDV